MRDWVLLATAIIQSITAIIILINSRKQKKGTKRSRPGKR